MSNIPIVSFWEVLKNTRTILKNPLIFHKKKFHDLGDTFTIQSSSSENFILTRDPEFVQYILQKNHKNYEKSRIQTQDLAKYVGHGLLTSNGKSWMAHRRMIQPGFSKKKMAGLFEVVHAVIIDEIKHIKNGTTQDVFPLMSDLAFQVVAQSLFSSDDIRGRMKRLQEITLDAQNMFIKEMRQPYLLWWYKLTGKIQKHLKLGEEARSIIRGIINERKRSGKDKDDLLDMLLSSRYEDGSPMSERQLIDEVMILFTAGHETTANALSFVLFHVAKDSSIQKRILSEVETFDFKDENLINAFTKLPFTRKCIEEAMRLYPPAYFMDRVAKEDDEFQGKEIKKGNLVLMSLFEIHRDERYWSNGDEFIPDRSEEAKPKGGAIRYYPFGAGPRMCVGNHFAMFEMILLVAEIVRTYTLSTKLKEVELIPLISLKPKSVPIYFSSKEGENY